MQFSHLLAIQLRYEIAKTLGYQFHADFKTEIAVIKTGKAALGTTLFQFIILFLIRFWDWPEREIFPAVR